MTATQEREFSCLYQHQQTQVTRGHARCLSSRQSRLSGQHMDLLGKSLSREAKNEKIAVQRQREMAKFMRRMQPKILKALHGQTQEAVGRVERGQAPIPLGFQSVWGNQLRIAEVKESQLTAFTGWTTAEAQHFKTYKSVTTSLSARAPDGETEEAIVGIGALGQGTESFLTSPTRQEVSGYLKTTSKKQAGTHAKKINKVYERLRDEVIDEAGSVRGASNRALARALKTEMGWKDKVYSKMIARTTTTWAYNEGSLWKYREQGIQKMEWWSTFDELTCPFCSSMHQTVVSTSPGNSTFLGAGDSLTGSASYADGSTHQVSMTGSSEGTTHPPLHPNCRCTILPVIEGFEGAFEMDNMELPSGSAAATLPQTLIPPVPGATTIIPPETAAPKPTIEPQESNEVARETALRKVESVIVDHTVEHAVVVDSQGNLLVNKEGKKHSVSFTFGEVEKMQGGYATHNHPTPFTPPSSADITFLNMGLEELRTVNTRNRVIMHKTSKASEESIDEFARRYKRTSKARAHKAAKEYVQELRAQGVNLDDITFDDREGEYYQRLYAADIAYLQEQGSKHGIDVIVEAF